MEHPHPVWWLLVIGGLTLLAFQGFHAEFYAFWVDRVHPLPGQAVMAWIFYACIPIHVFEAGWAWRTAHRLGLSGHAAGWAAQGFALGWPSTRLLLRRKRAAAATAAVT